MNLGPAILSLESSNSYAESQSRDSDDWTAGWNTGRRYEPSSIENSATMKQGRNEICWCGSGKKYKHCHLNREHEPKPSIEQMLNVQRSVGIRKLCMHPEASAEVCSSTLVKAHTIQKSGSLAAIAENNEVMTFTSDLMPMLRSGGIPVERAVRIKSSSTFTGFCEAHDGPTFAPFETAPFVGSEEQCFLMSYRALCRELYGKLDYAEVVQKGSWYGRWFER